MAYGAPDSVSSLTDCNQQNLGKFDYTSFDAVFQCQYDSNVGGNPYRWVKYHECVWNGMWAWVTIYDNYVWCTTTSHSFKYDGTQPQSCTPNTCYVPPQGSLSSCNTAHPENCIWYGSYSSQSQQATTTTIQSQQATTTTVGSGSKPVGQSCYQLCAMDRDCCRLYPNDCLWGGYYCQEIPVFHD